MAISDSGTSAPQTNIINQLAMGACASQRDSAGQCNCVWISCKPSRTRGRASAAMATHSSTSPRQTRLALTWRLWGLAAWTDECRSWEWVMTAIFVSCWRLSLPTAARWSVQAAGIAALF